MKKINFTNYGYKKNKIDGRIFNRKFEIKLEDNLKKINFELLNTGVQAKLNLFNTNNELSYKGNFKGKFLKSNYKFDFIFNKSILKIDNFLFRDKNLSLDSNGLINFKPFFYSKLNSNINHININLIKNLNIKNLLSSSDLIKRLNSENNIQFKSNRLSRSLIDSLDIKSKLAYGILSISKEIDFSKSNFKCQNSVNLLDEYPVLYYDCQLNSSDKKKLLKNLQIKYKTKNEPLTLNFKGNLNILNNKINFDYIEMNNNYKATSEDLKYYKNTFEKILFNKNFLGIFDFSKIREFILEIS